jgi:hypothetical protein
MYDLPFGMSGWRNCGWPTLSIILLQQPRKSSFRRTNWLRLRQEIDGMKWGLKFGKEKSRSRIRIAGRSMFCARWPRLTSIDDQEKSGTHNRKTDGSIMWHLVVFFMFDSASGELLEF